MLTLLSGLALWRQSPLVFMLLAGVSLITGLSWYDTYTTNLGLTIGLSLIGYSFLSVAYAFKLFIWPMGEENE